MPFKSLPRALAIAALLGCTTLAGAPALADQATYSIPAAPIYYRTVKIDGLDIFYREAGPRNAPVILLLHGFPSSSHMFRDLIPLLADKYHVIAPDYPGFGYSTQPDRARFQYTFDNLYAVVDKFTRAVGAETFAIYVQDYGSPIGLRFALHQPERVTAMIVQNGNAYDVGLAPIWDPIKAYWAENTPERREALRDFVKERTTVFQYSEGVPAERRNPDAWRNDQWILDRPGNEEIQLDLFGDYRNNVKLYPAFQESFRRHQFPTLIVWGRNDPIFTVQGAEAFRTDLPKAEIHYLDAGHFALETDAAAIAGYIREFMQRAVKAPG
ncbi:MAG: alpha/beta hydrolase [Dongiaceae bacterium]